MKRTLTFLVILAMCFSFSGCVSSDLNATETGVESDMDLNLIVYRDLPEEDNLYNIERLTITYSWIDGYVEEIVMQYDCATEEDAQGAYDSLLEDYGDSLKIDGKRVTYNEDTAVWKYTKYEEVRNNYISKRWNIIDDEKYIMAMSTTEATEASDVTQQHKN